MMDAPEIKRDPVMDEQMRAGFVRVIPGSFRPIQTEDQLLPKGVVEINGKGYRFDIARGGWMAVDLKP